MDQRLAGLLSEEHEVLAVADHLLQGMPGKFAGEVSDGSGSPHSERGDLRSEAAVLPKQPSGIVGILSGEHAGGTQVFLQADSIQPRTEHLHRLAGLVLRLLGSEYGVPLTFDGEHQPDPLYFQSHRLSDDPRRAIHHCERAGLQLLQLDRRNQSSSHASELQENL